MIIKTNLFQYNYSQQLLQHYPVITNLFYYDKEREQVYKKLYPAGRFYGIPKIHKLSINSGTSDLPLNQWFETLTLHHITSQNFFLSYYHLYGNQEKL